MLRKFYLLFFIPQIALGQITITQNDFPQQGTHWDIYNDNPPTGIVTVSPGSSAPQNWNYSNTFTVDDTSALGFVDPVPLAGSSYFPNSNLGYSLFFFGTISIFFRTDSTGLYIEGQYATFPASTHLTTYTNKLFIPAPVTYGTNVLNTNRTTEIVMYDSTASSPSTMHVIYETTYYKCNAWGTMSTPLASNVPVLRIRSGTVFKSDSLFIDSTGTGTAYVFNSVTNSGPEDNIDHTFICNGQTILASVLLDSTTNTVVSTSYYNSVISGIKSETNVHPSFQLYPNPVSGSTIFISTDDPVTNANYEILNSLSNTVMNGTFNGSFHILETNLTPGIYFVKITSASETTTRKLIVR